MMATLPPSFPVFLILSNRPVEVDLDAEAVVVTEARLVVGVGPRAVIMSWE